MDFSNKRSALKAAIRFRKAFDPDRSYRYAVHCLTWLGREIWQVRVTHRDSGHFLCLV